MGWLGYQRVNQITISPSLAAIVSDNEEKDANKCAERENIDELGWLRYQRANQITILPEATVSNDEGKDADKECNNSVIREAEREPEKE